MFSSFTKSLSISYFAVLFSLRFRAEEDDGNPYESIANITLAPDTFVRFTEGISAPPQVHFLSTFASASFSLYWFMKPA